MVNRASEQEIDVNGRAPKGVYTGEAGGADPEPHPSRMLEIIAAIDDPEKTDLEAINRLIAMEIALTITDPGLKWNPRSTGDKVKALQALAKTLQDGDSLAKKDFLNFDGPKFKYVLGELVGLFKSSLKSSGFKEEDINHTLRIFRDSLSLRETDLRRETERVTNESLFINIAAPETPAQGK